MILCHQKNMYNSSLTVHISMFKIMMKKSIISAKVIGKLKIVSS